MESSGRVTSPPLPAFAPSLATLVAPLAPGEFLGRAWRKAALHCPGGAERLAPLLEAIGGLDVERLLQQSERLAVLGLDTSHAGEFASHAAAMEAYRSRGATLYFRMKRDWHLRGWIDAIAADLGEPPGASVSFFAVRGRHGTPAHLDWNENFTVQLSGTKRWDVSRQPADFLRQPVTNWAIGDPAPPHADAARLPVQLPQDAHAHLLTPGSVLYVPRGHLHKVTSVDNADSLSLNLCFPPTTWANMLGALLAERLMALPELREAITGAFGNGWDLERVLERLPERLRHLLAQAGALDGDFRALLRDPARLEEFLAKRGDPRP